MSARLLCMLLLMLGLMIPASTAVSANAAEPSETKSELPLDRLVGKRIGDFRLNDICQG